PHLANIEGVINIGSTYDKSVLVTLLANQDQDFSKLIVGTGVEGEVSWVPGLGIRTTKYRMAKLDWEVVSFLLRDAERKLDEVAKQLKVSTRTVKRRLNSMMKEAAIFTMPMVDLRKTEGISYQLRVQIEQGKKLEVEKSVVAKIGNVVVSASDSENGSGVGFTGSNVAEGSDVLEWVKQQPGVISASMTIAEMVGQVFAWIESEVERRMRTMPVREPSPERKMQQTIGIRS